MSEMLIVSKILIVMAGAALAHGSQRTNEQYAMTDDQLRALEATGVPLCRCPRSRIVDRASEGVHLNTEGQMHIDFLLNPQKIEIPAQNIIQQTQSILSREGFKITPKVANSGVDLYFHRTNSSQFYTPTIRTAERLIGTYASVGATVADSSFSSLAWEEKQLEITRAARTPAKVQVSLTR
jgi:hypothetical protein